MKKPLNIDTYKEGLKDAVVKKRIKEEFERPEKRIQHYEKIASDIAKFKLSNKPILKKDKQATIVIPNTRTDRFYQESFKKEKKELLRW